MFLHDEPLKIGRLVSYFDTVYAPESLGREGVQSVGCSGNQAALVVEKAIGRKKQTRRSLL